MCFVLVVVQNVSRALIAKLIVNLRWVCIRCATDLDAPTLARLRRLLVKMVFLRMMIVLSGCLLIHYNKRIPVLIRQGDN